MNNFGLRIAKDKNVFTTAMKNLSATSEANQWKIHMYGSKFCTADNQVLTVEHGLPYTPAFLFFKRQNNEFVVDDFFTIGTVGGSTYINSTTLSLQFAYAGDQIVYIIFKDFSA